MKAKQQANNTLAGFIYLVEVFLPALLISLVVSGCAFDVYHIKLTPVQIDTSIATKSSFILSADVELDIGYGYERRLVKGTVWRYMGGIPYGDVYHSKDQVLTVEASNIYEAYLVVSAGTLVGFYLPIENAYYPLAEHARLPVQVDGSEL